MMADAIQFNPDEEEETDTGEAIYIRPKITRVPNGQYDLLFSYFETRYMFHGKSPKIALHFTITNHGDYYGKEVIRWYNAGKIIGKPCKGGRFNPAPRSDFIYDIARLFNWRPTGKRRDRIPMSIFNGAEIVGLVETAKKDQIGRDVPDVLQSSVVRKLIKLKGPP